MHQLYKTHKLTPSTHPLAIGSSMAAHRRQQAGLAFTGRIASKGLLIHVIGQVIASARNYWAAVARVYLHSLYSHNARTAPTTYSQYR